MTYEKRFREKIVTQNFSAFDKFDLSSIVYRLSSIVYRPSSIVYRLSSIVYRLCFSTCPFIQVKKETLAGNKTQVLIIYIYITVTRNDNNTSETYIGLTKTDLETRHRNHIASFRHAKHKNSTELSKHIWAHKNDNIHYSISWRVLSSSSPYNSSSKKCNLCLKEKFLIICRPDLSSIMPLKKRNELRSSTVSYGTSATLVRHF